MALISNALPHLFNGVSQQAASLRHTSQCEAQDNCFPSIATGNRKRPPTLHRAKLNGTTNPDVFVHQINRDSTQRYSVIIGNGTIEVFDIATGAAQTVLTPDGVGYLAAATPREMFTAMTVADFTFIVNKTVVTAMGAAVTGGVLTGTVQSFSALPGAPALNSIYRIEGTPESNFDDYYVIWNGSVWVEHTKPGEIYQLNAATMPYKLTKTGATQFTFQKITWADRLVGDVLSNPQPSFIGVAIKDVFFYRNRLGFIADENVVLSRSGEYFTFWAETVTAVLDSDPVDNSVSHTKVSILNSAVPFNKALMLFSGETQFQLTSGDTLTPKTAKIDPVTEFVSSSRCRPVSLGQQLFFAVETGNSTGIREYYVEQDTLSNDAADTTAHVPSYIPKNVFHLASCTAEDLVFALTLNERNAVYLYKFYWSGEEKVQSSWGRLLFATGDVVLSVEFVSNTAYFHIQRSDGIYLEVMEMGANITDADFGFTVHLDRRQELLGVYDAVNDWTTWTLGFVDASDFTVVLGTAFGVDSAGALNTTRPTTSTIRAVGNYSAGTCYVGRKYTERYRFSEQYVRDGKNVAVTTGTLKLRRMAVNYDQTAYFRAEVTPLGRSTYTYEFTGQVVGELVLGAASLKTGTFSFPVSTSNIGVVIDLVNDSYLPSRFQSAEWVGEFTLKSSRR